MNGRFSRAQIGRSDLCTLLSYAETPEQRAAFCRLLGFNAPEQKFEPKHVIRTDSGDGKTDFSQFSTGQFREEVKKPDPDHIKLPFFHITSYQPVDPEQSHQSAPPWFVHAQKFNKKDLTLPQAQLPDAPPLVPWTRLWPVIKNVVSKIEETGTIDIRRLTALIANCEPFTVVPRASRKNWLREIHLLLDKKEDLRPFFDDMNRIASGFRVLCRKSSLKVFNFSWGITYRQYHDVNNSVKTYHPPSSGAAVLVISDLGLLSNSPADKKAWEEFGNRLNRNNIALSALTPCPPYLWEHSICRYWKMLYWDLHKRPAKSTGLLNRSQKTVSTERFPPKKQEGLEKLLHLFSPIVSLEPGMIRILRTLLPDELTDAAMEYELWRLRYCLPAYQSQFAGADFIMRKRILDFVEQYHGGIVEVADAELKIIGNLAQKDMKELVDNVADRILIKNYNARLVKTFAEIDSTDLDSASFKAWFSSTEKLMPAAVWNDEKMAALWAISHRDDNAPMPKGIEFEKIRWIIADKAEKPVRWLFYQNGVAVDASPDNVPVRYPLGSLTTIGNIALVTKPGVGEDAVIRWDTHTPFQNTITEGGGISPVKITSFLESIDIEPTTLPPWAEEIGRDEYGLYVDIEVKSVRQRMRWINPGKFLMGSPEGEEGRLDNEKQHPVVLTAGYWMFDTPVTQAWWVAVMGNNPSYFKSPDRPVEQVSWDDCREFIKRVNQLVPELELRFPTEAEWEYACRAGSETATYAGEMNIIGGNNAPVLDEIAWYRGNSGNDFKLDNGYDSSDWPYKQYDHKKAGSHPVARRLPNIWGLYDMIGNVDEWCGDWYGDYPLYLSENPVGPEKDENRVLRGGSWFNNARSCRSAYRSSGGPMIREFNLGFRLSRGQQEPGELEVARTGQPEGTAGGHARRPDAPEIVQVPEILLYKWHRESGQDKFGVWIAFAYKEAVQRMRWIKPGRFLMGSPDDESERSDDEMQHEVILTQGYWLADTACTQELWKMVMGDNPSSFKGAQRPVANVSWDDCQYFLQKINSIPQLPGISLCIPTEAQWEYACRAGTLTPFSFGENITPAQVNYDGNYPYFGGKKGMYRRETVEVKALPPNDWGLYEMHGNVLEWCTDWYDNYNGGTIKNPIGAAKGLLKRVLRGGSWFDYAWDCRSAYRYFYRSDLCDNYFGFRLSRGQGK